MGGKLGKNNTYIVSGGGGAGYSSHMSHQMEEDRRHSSDGSVQYSDSSVQHSGVLRKNTAYILLWHIYVGFFDLKLFFSCADEPVYNSAASRRKSVFAEAYNPEEDDGDDTKVKDGYEL